MRKFKRLLTILLASVMTLSVSGSLVGCGGGTKEGCLTIRYYEGGFGSEWLRTSVEQFVATKEGVTYELIPDESVTDNALNLLKSGVDVPDIIMPNGGLWQEWVSAGYLEALDDV
ncbi:MAG: hypothetical protein E7369_06155, partial [Clostridiales bacterium]|nr:hypothetical protein [Clostridiales bacterium]